MMALPSRTRLAAAGTLAFPLAVLLATFPGLALAAAGTIQFVAGSARVVSPAGTERTAVRGMNVDEGDTVITGSDSRLQMRMIDRAVLALRPDTRVQVQTYQFSGTEDGNERGVLQLATGMLRSLTGLIGRTRKDRLLVVTPTATVGIRGTDHEVAYIPPASPGATPPSPPGTYDKVNTGLTFITNATGRVDIAPNQVGYAPVDTGVAPTRLPRMPDFLRATPPMPARTTSNGGSTGNGNAAANDTGSPGDTSSSSNTASTSEGSQGGTSGGSGNSSSSSNSSNSTGDSRTTTSSSTTTSDNSSRSSGSSDTTTSGTSGTTSTTSTTDDSSRRGSSTTTTSTTSTTSVTTTDDSSGRGRGSDSSITTNTSSGITPTTTSSSGTTSGSNSTGSTSTSTTSTTSSSSTGSTTTTDDKKTTTTSTTTQTVTTTQPSIILTAGTVTYDFTGASSGLTAATSGLAVASAAQRGTTTTVQTVTAADGVPVLLDSTGNVSLFTDKTRVGYTTVGGTQQDKGSTNFRDGTTTLDVTWGVYSGGTFVDSGGVRTPDFVALITGQVTPASVASSLNATYSSVAGQSKLATETGRLGGSISSIGITVRGGSLAAYSIALRDAASRAWSASCSNCGTAGIPLTTFATSGATLSGTGADVAATGRVAGTPIGPSGAGFISAFGLSTSDGRSVTGAVLAK